MAPDDRSERLQLRISEGERAMLADLAEADGLSMSDVVRLLVRRAHAERFGSAKPATKTKKK